MSSYGMKAVEFALKYPPMGIEKRRELLPYKSVSSLYPAKADEDVLVTANGRQRIDIVGDPYHERVIYRRERIMAREGHARTAGCGLCDPGSEKFSETGEI